jgi:hypothetical protein
VRWIRCTLALLALTACGIQPDAAPRDLPEDERAIAIGVTPSGSDAAGANRIYLVAPGEERLLRAVPREATTRAELINVLLAGPNDDELAAQYSSVIPPETELISARKQGQILTINLSAAITELTGGSLALAVAQIVYTAAELDGVEAVQLRVENKELAWPTGNTGTTTGPLRIYDYPNAIVTSQPAFPAVPAAS